MMGWNVFPLPEPRQGQDPETFFSDYVKFHPSLVKQKYNAHHSKMERPGVF